MTSHPAPTTKVSLTELTDRKSRGEKLVMVTAYDHPGARLADAAGVDIILVGDSAADNVLGYDTTVPVTVDGRSCSSGPSPADRARWSWRTCLSARSVSDEPRWPTPSAS
jgi:hypothetical protein